MSRLVAGVAVPAAVAALVAGGDGGPAVAWIVPLGVVAALGAVWLSGTFGGRRRSEWAVAGLLAVPLAAGALAAAGRFGGTGALGLPLSVWGLLFGVWIVPLALTSGAFALFFRPPDEAALRRAAGRERRE